MNQSQAASELLRRRAARLSLLDYARYLIPEYQTPKHIQELAAALEKVESGEIDRLMVFEPPRHGKSMLVSQVFPCWYLGRNPEREVVQSGYSQDISLEHSRKARDLFVSGENGAVFPDLHHAPGRDSQDAIAVKHQAAAQWGTRQGGRYRAVGVGGGITGFGLDLGIIDDPVKNREDANSPTICNKTWDWYRSTLYTRRSPIAAIVLVMTRWSTDDLAARLLKEMAKGDGDDWTIIEMPAINEAGEALWPERWPVEELERIRRSLGAFEWSSLYQQNPVVRGGNLFKVDGIQWHDSDEDFPETRYVRFWDLASTAKERAKDDPDYTVGALGGVTQDADGLNQVWVKDIVAVQHEAPERDARIIATSERDGPGVQIAVESVAGYKDTYTNLKRILKGKRTVHKVNVSTDKVVRAAPLEPIFEAGNIHVVRGPGARLFEEHFTAFPSEVVHDDVVDAVSGVYSFIVNKPNPVIISRKKTGV